MTSREFSIHFSYILASTFLVQEGSRIPKIKTDFRLLFPLSGHGCLKIGFTLRGGHLGPVRAHLASGLLGNGQGSLSGPSGQGIWSHPPIGFGYVTVPGSEKALITYNVQCKLPRYVNYQGVSSTPD